MKTFFSFLLFMISVNVFGQARLYDVSKDPKEDGGLIFNGPVTFDDLNREPTFTWLKSGIDAYTPDVKKMNYLQQHLKDYSLVIFLGTWCDDSHELIPKLEKVLQGVDYPLLSAVTMFGVDREKKTKNGDEKKYNVTFVPTIIVYKGGREAGRITESVDKSIEGDLAAIIQKDTPEQKIR